MMFRISTLLALEIVSAVQASVTGSTGSAPPSALPEYASEWQKKFQPYIDFDKDSCYNVPPIGPNGEWDWGLPSDFLTTATEDCRDESDLDNSNVYVRTRCNNGWCVYFYSYYFEKDAVELTSVGHTYDWENCAVWVKGDDETPTYVSVSGHGEYEIWDWNKYFTYWDEPRSHVLIVYHREGRLTHSMRFANQDDYNGAPENHKGIWQAAPLVGWHQMPTSIRDQLNGASWGKANFALQDSKFTSRVEDAMPDQVKNDGFDPAAES